VIIAIVVYRNTYNVFSFAFVMAIIQFPLKRAVDWRAEKSAAVAFAQGMFQRDDIIEDSHIFVIASRCDLKLMRIALRVDLDSREMTVFDRNYAERAHHLANLFEGFFRTSYTVRAFYYP
jgi:hypothetical protein